MGFEKGRVSPETRLALVETIKGTQEDEKKNGVDGSFSSTTAKPKRAGFDSNANTNAKSSDEDMASSPSNSLLGRDPRSRRRLFDRLLILVTFVSFATLILALSLAFVGLGPTCSCPGKKTTFVFCILHRPILVRDSFLRVSGCVLFSLSLHFLASIGVCGSDFSFNTLISTSVLCPVC